jgi:hypothetical protein
MHRDKNALIKGIQEHFTNEDNKFAVTITFIEGTSDSKAKEAFNQLIHLVNSKLYGKKYLEKEEQFIHGFGVIERQSNDTIHFHAIIQDSNGLESIMSFSKAFLLSVPKIRKNRKIGTSRRLIGDKGFDIARYYRYDDSGFEEYITKKFKYMFYDNIHKYWFPFSKDMRISLN